MIHVSGYGTRKMDDETQPVGATPGDDISGLLMAKLATRAARHAVETESISRAYDKHIFRARRKKRASQWLTEEFLALLLGEWVNEARETAFLEDRSVNAWFYGA